MGRALDFRALCIIVTRSALRFRKEKKIPSGCGSENSPERGRGPGWRSVAPELGGVRGEPGRGTLPNKQVWGDSNLTFRVFKLVSSKRGTHERFVSAYGMQGTERSPRVTDLTRTAEQLQDPSCSPAILIFKNALLLLLFSIYWMSS